MMTEEDFEDDMEELVSAEDFLEYFSIEYEQSVVHVNRLHILQRFNEYLAKAEDSMPDEVDAKTQAYARLLKQAYEDFVTSDAQTEKVFKVFHMHEPQQAFVSLDSIIK